MRERVKMDFNVKLALGIIFAAQAGAILSGIESLENIGYALAVFVVIFRVIGIAGVSVLSVDDLHEALDKVYWHWVMLFPVFAMAASGWVAMAIIYGVVEFVFMTIAYHYKKIEGRK